MQGGGVRAAPESALNALMAQLGLRIFFRACGTRTLLQSLSVKRSRASFQLLTTGATRGSARAAAIKPAMAS
jgi:hypothetical protein